MNHTIEYNCISLDSYLYLCILSIFLSIKTIISNFKISLTFLEDTELVLPVPFKIEAYPSLFPRTHVMIWR